MKTSHSGNFWRHQTLYFSIFGDFAWKWVRPKTQIIKPQKNWMTIIYEFFRIVIIRNYNNICKCRIYFSNLMNLKKKYVNGAFGCRTCKNSVIQLFFSYSKDFCIPVLRCMLLIGSVSQCSKSKLVIYLKTFWIVFILLHCSHCVFLVC